MVVSIQTGTRLLADTLARLIPAPRPVQISAGPNNTFANSTPPYSLVVYNATFVVDDKGMHFDKVPLEAKSGIDPVSRSVLFLRPLPRALR